MEIYERIRFLRKEKLKMSQDAFGDRLGVSRSVIKNIELNVLARPEQKLSLIKLICKEFNVSEKWLLDGEGPMEAPADMFCLEDYLKERNATDLEISIMKAYFELDPEIRETVIQNFKNWFSNRSLPDQFPDNPDELAPGTKDSVGQFFQMNNCVVPVNSVLYMIMFCRLQYTAYTFGLFRFALLTSGFSFIILSPLFFIYKECEKLFVK